MREKNHWKQIWEYTKKQHFWKKCLLFDLFCICLAFAVIMSGMGRGAKVKQQLTAALQKQEDAKLTSAKAQGDTGETEDEIKDNQIDGQNLEKKKVALTFDDGPHPQYTPEMIAGLKERNVKATFFLLGQEVENILRS